MDPKCSLLYSPEFITGPEAGGSGPDPHTLFLSDSSYNYIYLHLCLPSGPFPRATPTKILYAPLIAHMDDIHVCLNLLTLLHFFTLLIFYEE
jgi:hypothetical protein